ncbi:unnamed protein product [Caenorhabditis auriculariae]|uniref:RecA family profile 1 domain-containing protein n=1 Tax=Caenorhabditis auriculariae TaxID=2777116 RepID=A0A8S1H0G6_9PELO|nr:unnamed protein product [Caenorhabditis auriculariae]
MEPMEIDGDYVEETAFELLQRLGFGSVRFGTELESLNEIVQLVPGQVYEMNGDVCSGKTQICYSIVSKLLKEDDEANVMWISSLPFRTDHFMKHAGEENNERLLQATVDDYNQLRDFLFKLERDLKGTSVRLIIIDSVSCMMHDTVWTDHDERHRCQSIIIEKLKRLSRYEVAILMTSHITYWDGAPRPSLGKFWVTSFPMENRFFVEALADGRTRSLSTMREDETVDIAKFCIRDGVLAEIDQL